MLVSKLLPTVYSYTGQTFAMTLKNEHRRHQFLPQLFRTCKTHFILRTHFTFSQGGLYLISPFR